MEYHFVLSAQLRTMFLFWMGAVCPASAALAAFTSAAINYDDLNDKNYSVHDPSTAIIHLDNFFGAQIDAVAKAGVDSLDPNHFLMVSNSISGSGALTSRYVSSFASWSDSLALTPPAIGGTSLAKVRFTFEVSGSVTSTHTSGPGGSFTDMSASILTGATTVGQGSLHVINDGIFKPTVFPSGWGAGSTFVRSDPSNQATVDVHGILAWTITINLATPATIPWYAELQTQSAMSVPLNDPNAIYSGTASTSFQNSMALKSLMMIMPDGSQTTPESLGYGVKFASGMRSPNVVPEPSSILLAALGLLGTVAHGIRQRGKRRMCQLPMT